MPKIPGYEWFSTTGWAIGKGNSEGKLIRYGVGVVGKDSEECGDVTWGNDVMGWGTRTLGEICDQVGGIIRTGPFGSQLHQSDYQDEGAYLRQS